MHAAKWGLPQTSMRPYRARLGNDSSNVGRVCVGLLGGTVVGSVSKCSQNGL